MLPLHIPTAPVWQPGLNPGPQFRGPGAQLSLHGLVSLSPHPPGSQVLYSPRFILARLAQRHTARNWQSQGCKPSLAPELRPTMPPSTAVVGSLCHQPATAALRQGGRQTERASGLRLWVAHPCQQGESGGTCSQLAAHRAFCVLTSSSVTILSWVLLSCPLHR